MHILAIHSATSAYSTTEQYKLLSNFKVENGSETEKQRGCSTSTSTHSANNVCLYEWLLCEKKLETAMSNRRDGANHFVTQLIPHNENKTFPMLRCSRHKKEKEDSDNDDNNEART